MRGYYGALQESDTQVLGISTDAMPVQAVYATSLGGIPYPVLADFFPQGKVSKQYGVFNEENGRSLRALFLIDKRGIVRWRDLAVRPFDMDFEAIIFEIGRLES